MLAKVYYYLAIAYKKMGDLEKSKDYTLKAHEKLEIISDKKAYAELLTRIAEKNEADGDFAEAIKYSTMALDVYRDCQDEYELGEIELNLGKLYEDFEKYDLALIHLKKAEVIYHKTPTMLMEVYYHLAECYAHLGQKSDAFDVLAYLDKVVLEEDFLGNIRLYRVKSKVESLFNNMKGAVNNLILALNQAKEKKLRTEESEILILMAKYYLDKGKNVDSYRLLEKHLHIVEDEKGGN
ncbi:MAG: tetratricopeptide repeat protein [Clostridium sp.]|nr:tetratricopeptide repeat protein [Clostridium sp.]